MVFSLVHNRTCTYLGYIQSVLHVERTCTYIDSLTHHPSSQGWAPECPLGFCPCVLYGVRVVITFLSSLYALS